MSSLMGSGSGNDPPQIQDCPTVPLTVRGLLADLVEIPFSIPISTSDEDEESLTMEIRLDPSIMLDFANVTRNALGQSVLRLPGNGFSSANRFVEINVTVIATDALGAMSEPCNFLLEVTLFEASLCVNPHLPFTDIFFTLFSVTLIGDIQRDQVSTSGYDNGLTNLPQPSGNKCHT